MSNTATANALVSRAVLRDFRATPQKARRVVNLVRGQRADTALNMMKFYKILVQIIVLQKMQLMLYK